MSRAIQILIPSSLLILLLFILINAAHRKSLVYDEVIYPAVGTIYWKTGDIRINNVHPPLQKYISSLPLLAHGVNVPMNINPEKTDEWRVGYQFFFLDNKNAPQLVFLARLPTILFTVIMVGILFWWTTRKYGFEAGILSSVLLAFDPLLLANGALAMNDIFVTFFMFLSCLSFIKFVEGKKWAVIPAGIFAGLAITCKLSGIILAPIFIFWFFWKRHTDLRGNKNNWGRTLAEGTALLFLTILTILLVYRFDFDNISRAITITSDIHGKKPAGFLLGPIYGMATWIYYPVALLIKTPIPIILIWIFSFFCLFKIKPKPTQAFFYLGASLIIFLFAMASRNYFGLRYILPALPLMSLFVGMVYSKMNLQKKEKCILWSLVGWLILESIFIHPHYMAYFNQLIGGSSQGYKWLDGSNQDWGQDISELNRYLKKEGDPYIYMGYVGSNFPEAWGVTYQDVISPALTSGYRQNTIHPVEINRELLVVSANLRSNPDMKQVYAWLDHKKPIAFIGYTLFIYDVTNDIESLQEIANIYAMTGREKMLERQLKRIAYIKNEVS